MLGSAESLFVISNTCKGKIVLLLCPLAICIYLEVSQKNADENSLMDSVGEGEGGKIWENGIETCKISCMK